MRMKVEYASEKLYFLMFNFITTKAKSIWSTAAVAAAAAAAEAVVVVVVAEEKTNYKLLYLNYRTIWVWF